MSEKKDLVEIYTDGSSLGNPGPGGYGVILRYLMDDKKNNFDKKIDIVDGNVYEKVLRQGFVLTTNNRMELLAVIMGLEILRKKCRVKIYSDSKYVVDSIKKGWIDSWQNKKWRKSDKTKVKNIDLWKRLLPLLEMHDIEFIWVKGHDVNKINNRCDELAVSASNSNDLIIDEGYHA